MPIHDWAAAPAGLFHHFHQSWSVTICNALNGGLLPGGFYALVEQSAIDLIPDVLTLASQTRAPHKGGSPDASGGGVVIASEPKTRFVSRADPDVYTSRANRVVVRSTGGEVVAVIEIVSPGNKVSRQAVRSFAEKAAALLQRGINLLVIDLLPPTVRDPEGIHRVIWDEFHDEAFVLPPEKQLTLAAYSAGVPTTAYVEPVAVGDPLPDMPVFLDPGTHVPLPLEQIYGATWDACPVPFKEAVGGAAGDHAAGRRA